MKETMKNKLLLHSCCAPCSTSVIEDLKEEFDITILFYNPNIEPEEEYLKRKEEQLKYLNKINIPHLEIDYQNNKFHKAILGYENEPEKGKRCQSCIFHRLKTVAKVAKEKECDVFTTTLTVSPHKDSEFINDTGAVLARRYQVKYLIGDFKKENGYQKSIELAKEHNLYRQNYCGCRYSRRG